MTLPKAIELLMLSLECQFTSSRTGDCFKPGINLIVCNNYSELTTEKETESTTG